MRLVITLAGLTALAAITWLAIDRAAPRLQTDIAAAGTVSMIDAGFRWARIDADGRTLRVAGIAPDADTQLRALALAAVVPGVRSVKDATRIARLRKVLPAAIVIDYGNDGITIAGKVRDRAVEQALLGAARNVFAGKHIASSVTVDATVPEIEQHRLDDALAALSHLKIGTVTLAAGTVQIHGQAASPGGRQRAIGALSAATPPGIEAEVDIHVPQPQQSAATCQTALDAVLAEGIDFVPDGVAIRRSSHDVLDQVVRVLLACPGLDVAIDAHTDRGGDETSNRQLTAARAGAVRDYLVSGDVETARITTRGYGSSHPISADMTPAGRRANRRIEITIGTPDS